MLFLSLLLVMVVVMVNHTYLQVHCTLIPEKKKKQTKFQGKVSLFVLLENVFPNIYMYQLHTTFLNLMPLIKGPHDMGAQHTQRIKVTHENGHNNFALFLVIHYM